MILQNRNKMKEITTKLLREFPPTKKENQIAESGSNVNPRELKKL